MKHFIKNSLLIELNVDNDGVEYRYHAVGHTKRYRHKFHIKSADFNGISFVCLHNRFIEIKTIETNKVLPQTLSLSHTHTHR